MKYPIVIEKFWLDKRQFTTPDNEYVYIVN